MPDQSDTTDYPPPSGDGDVHVSPRMIDEGVKDLMYVLDRGGIKLGDAAASIYRTMERVRRQEVLEMKLRLAPINPAAVVKVSDAI